jgi:hypothetical protein
VAGTYTPIGDSVVLPTDVGKRGSELKFLVFGSVSVELRCTVAGACAMSHALLVNGRVIPTTGLSFFGKAGDLTREQHGSAFGVVTVRSTGPVTGVDPIETRVRWGYRTGNNVADASAGTNVGAIRLGS